MNEQKKNMTTKRANWISKENNIATCKRCGAISKYMKLIDWYTTSYSPVEKNFLYWKWWKEFKKCHKKCVSKD